MTRGVLVMVMLLCCSKLLRATEAAAWCEVGHYVTWAAAQSDKTCLPFFRIPGNTIHECKVNCATQGPTKCKAVYYDGDCAKCKPGYKEYNNTGVILYPDYKCLPCPSGPLLLANL